MRPLEQFPLADRQSIRFVLADLDDTLTTDGRLTSDALRALEQLQAAGIKTALITGRPAGWCDHFARMWPVDGVVGENGAFYFAYDNQTRSMRRQYERSPEQRVEDRSRLKQLSTRILEAIPGAAISADQAYRENDLAIDICEDVNPLAETDINRIVEMFEAEGAQAKISSIHVNGWFGDHDKLSTSHRFFAEVLDQDISKITHQVVFVGDSPNDAPMFHAFPNSVGVQNVADFKDRLPHKPTWITPARGGAGFTQLTHALTSVPGEYATP